jgi:hypothetical protein
MRSQTATEYLVILSVAVLIALLVIGSFANISILGGPNTDTSQKTVLIASDFAVMDYVSTQTGTKLILQNNKPYSIELSSISLNGINCSTTHLPRLLSTGSKITVACTNIRTNSSRYRFTLGTTHTQVHTGATFNTTLGVLSGVTGTGAIDVAQFVVMGQNSDKVAYSLDGISWFASQMPLSANWRKPVYGADKFVTVATGTNISAYSYDGITWQLSRLPMVTNWIDPAYNGNMFVTLGNYNSRNASYSYDGITWYLAPILPVQPGQWSSVISVNSLFFAQGNSALQLVSSNGINWTIPTFSNYTYGYIEPVFGNGVYFAPASSYGVSSAIYSIDGYNWTTFALPLNSFWFSPRYQGGYLVCQKNGASNLLYSTNGLNWSMTTLTHAFHSPIYANGIWVAFGRNLGNGENERWYAVNISSWLSGSGVYGGSYYEPVYHTGLFVSTTLEYNATYSYNGINWSLTQLPFVSTWLGVVARK